MSTSQDDSCSDYFHFWKKKPTKTLLITDTDMKCWEVCVLEKKNMFENTVSFEEKKNNFLNAKTVHLSTKSLDLDFRLRLDFDFFSLSC